MKDVVIVGAGLAGLNCALTLQAAGLDVALLEASDAPGGRVRTDKVEGFLLDRGFQVLLTAYPEAQAALDYSALDLRPFKPGALVWHGGRFHRFADPFREPLAALKLALDPVITPGDKIGVARLRGRVTSGSLASLFSREETTTRQYLQDFRFSPKIITRFFQPFFGGVFLENDLVTSSRYFEFLFRMFSTGAVAVPASGMGAIPAQLADRLRPGTLQLNSRVKEVAAQGRSFTVSPEGRSSLLARNLVIATEEPETRRLLNDLNPMPDESPSRAWNCTTAFYFAAKESPVDLPILILNGEGRGAGPVNNAVVMSDVASSYAPAGAHLLSASVVGKAPATPERLTSLEQKVRDHLTQWFGPRVRGWKSIGNRIVAQAQPLQTTAQWESGNPHTGSEGVFVCGDFLETSSIQGSLASGRRAGEAVVQHIAR